jgi:hypothetical protein
MRGAISRGFRHASAARSIGCFNLFVCRTFSGSDGSPGDLGRWLGVASAAAGVLDVVAIAPQERAPGSVEETWPSGACDITTAHGGAVFAIHRSNVSK